MQFQVVCRGSWSATQQRQLSQTTPAQVTFRPDWKIYSDQTCSCWADWHQGGPIEGLPGTTLNLAVLYRIEGFMRRL